MLERELAVASTDVTVSCLMLVLYHLHHEIQTMTDRVMLRPEKIVPHERFYDFVGQVTDEGILSFEASLILFRMVLRNTIGEPATIAELQTGGESSETVVGYVNELVDAGYAVWTTLDE